MQILEELYYGNIRPDVKFYKQDSPFVELAWVGAMNNIKACAEEIVLQEIVYV